MNLTRSNSFYVVLVTPSNVYLFYILLPFWICNFSNMENRIWKRFYSNCKFYLMADNSSTVQTPAIFSNASNLEGSGFALTTNSLPISPGDFNSIGLNKAKVSIFYLCILIIPVVSDSFSIQKSTLMLCCYNDKSKSKFRRRFQCRYQWRLG